MTKSEAVLRQALELDDEERAELAGRLLESIAPPSDADFESSWGEEIRRRVARIDAGEAELTPWAEVREDLVRRLDGRV
jgi:putative addiction module component (TIGR02574 family)